SRSTKRLSIRDLPRGGRDPHQRAPAARGRERSTLSSRSVAVSTAEHALRPPAGTARLGLVVLRRLVRLGFRSRGGRSAWRRIGRGFALHPKRHPLPPRPPPPPLTPPPP